MHAEGQENDLVVLGEKGRAQLSRDRAKYIRETVADTQKVQDHILTGVLLTG